MNPGKSVNAEVKLRCVEERGQKFHAIFQTLPRAGKSSDLTKSELAWWEGINRDASQSREPQSGERVAEDCFIDVLTSTVDVGCRAHQHNLSARLDRATYGRRCARELVEVCVHRVVREGAVVERDEQRVPQLAHAMSLQPRLLDEREASSTDRTRRDER